VTFIADAIVDWAAIGKVVAASLIAGLGTTLCFSLAVAGATRFAEMRRASRAVPATCYAVLALAGLAATLGAIVVGIAVMTNKG
jgi:hypothetical protein